ncbi:MAG: TIGR02677 family protein [Firmicutes bacterium]|nr:TIGR02677 family protein [Bacillota bacterium]
MTKRVREATYLIADNAERYRPIMRFFYLRHMEHQYTLTAEDVLAHLRATGLSSYTPEQCEQDLQQLVEWGNLTAEQDRERPRTLEEFLRRRLLYSITPYGIAFERLLTELESGGTPGGSLDTGLMGALYERLEELSRLCGAESPSGRAGLERIHRLWAAADGAHALFDLIGTQASDYLAAIRRSGRDEESGDVAAFLAYKELLADYLSAYVRELDDHGERIRSLLASWPQKGIPGRLVQSLTTYVMHHLPAPDGRPRDEAEERRGFERQVEALLRWFQPGGGLHTLQRRTVDTIAQVVREAQRLVERRSAVNRKRELEHLALAFASCRSLADAHRLAGIALGSAVARHISGSADAWTVEGSGSSWLLPSRHVQLNPVRRGPGARGTSAAVEPDGRRQAEALAAELERRRDAAKAWESLFAGGRLDFHNVAVDDPHRRDELLALVARCLEAPDRTAVAPDGSLVRLELPNDRAAGRLTAPDGTVHLPRFVLYRQEAGA